MVDDAAARLRRIEQDLHDGAQAQMVAVVMKLGLARDHLSTSAARLQGADLDRALELVDAAHRGAMEAITELRDLARGIHPPALDEGLGAALAGLAACSDLPVELVVDLPERPSRAIETIAYFCAAALLTNAAKHSGAQGARLEVLHQPGLVTMRVSDDGTGGARLEPGGGLAGLAERVETVDGRLRVESPARVRALDAADQFSAIVAAAVHPDQPTELTQCTERSEIQIHDAAPGHSLHIHLP